MATSAAIVSRDRLADLPQPNWIWVTPLWFRLLVALMGVIAAVLVAFAVVGLAAPLVSGAAGGWGGIEVGVAGVLAAGLGAAALRLCRPLDRGKWVRFAVTREGLYVPGRRSTLVFVPWRAVRDIAVERWYSKREHSAACLTLDLDEDLWPRFDSGVRIRGEGRVRKLTLNLVDLTGEEAAARLRACRDDSAGAPV